VEVITAHVKGEDMKSSIRISLLALLLAVSGCASLLGPPSSTKHAGSVVDYLYPDAKAAPQLQPEGTRLHPPVRVGVAFVPGCACGGGEPSEAEKTKLLVQVKESFAKYGYIGSIEIIPSSYLRARGGFDNLDQVSRMFNVEVIALVSYDQIQFNDTNSLAVLYWTIVGAYVIHGDKYDVQTLVDTSVFDISSRKLLFRAPGSSEVKGSASMAGFSAHTREAQGQGYQKAVDQMIPALHAELANFKERVKTDVAFKVENKPGYSGAGDFGWLGLILALSLCGVAHARRDPA
jgi:rhombotail lipoprotein